jgi:hypothetical protein
MANVRYSFVPKTLVKLLQFSCGFEGHNAIVPDDKQDRDGNRAHQRAIVRVRRRKNFKGADLGLQPRIGHEFDQLERTMRVSKPRLSQRLSPIQAEKPAMLLDDIAGVNLALALGA